MQAQQSAIIVEQPNNNRVSLVPFLKEKLRHHK